jgi:hypothetical protein
MPTLHARTHMRRHDAATRGLTWADIESIRRPSREPRTPVGLALASSFLAGAAVGMLIAVVIVAVLP